MKKQLMALQVLERRTILGIGCEKQMTGLEMAYPYGTLLGRGTLRERGWRGHDVSLSRRVQLLPPHPEHRRRYCRSKTWRLQPSHREGQLRPESLGQRDWVCALEVESEPSVFVGNGSYWLRLP
eukprot:1008052-Rhodomonas_salina.1